MTFCTVINCMDGRVQLPVNAYLRTRFKADYVDTITEAGPNLIFSEGLWNSATRSILNRIAVSIEVHNSVGVALVGHHDCAGHPGSYEIQVEHLKMGLKFLKQQVRNIEIIALWVDENWEVHEVA